MTTKTLFLPGDAGFNHPLEKKIKIDPSDSFSGGLQTQASKPTFLSDISDTGSKAASAAASTVNRMANFLKENPIDKPEDDLDTGRLLKGSKVFFVSGVSLLLVSAFITAFEPNWPIVPLVSVIGLMCQSVSTKLEHKSLVYKKKQAQLENQKLSLVVNEQKIKDSDLLNPDFEMSRDFQTKWVLRSCDLIQLFGLILLSASGIVPFLEGYARASSVLMQIGWVVFTAGAQIEQYQYKSEKRNYRKASLQLRMKLMQLQNDTN